MIERKAIKEGGRGHLVGDSHPNATISDERVEEMRKKYAAGISYRHLSKEFGVALVTVGRICRRECRNKTQASSVLVATEADYPRIAQMRAKGLSRAAIGNVLGATDSSIWRALVAMNLNKRKK